MCLSHRNDDRPRRSCRFPPGVDHPARAQIAVEISKVEIVHLRAAWVAWGEEPGAEIDQFERRDSLALGCRDSRFGGRNQIGRNRLQGVRERGSGIDEAVAGSRISANPDTADALLQAVISEFYRVLQRAENALPSADQPLDPKAQASRPPAGDPDRSRRNIEAIHGGSSWLVLSDGRQGRGQA